MRFCERKADRAREMLDRYEAGETLQELADGARIDPAKVARDCRSESRRRVRDQFGVMAEGDVRDAWEETKRLHKAGRARRKEEKSDVRTL